MRHPTRQQLFDYAESLLDRGGPVSVDLAGHVSRCARCTREVARIRKSLDFTAAAGDLEPRGKLTRQILMAARQEQQARRPGLFERNRLLRVLASAAAAVCAVLAGILVFSIAFPAEPGPREPMPTAGSTAVAAAPVPAPSATHAADIDALRKALEIARAGRTPAGQLLLERAARARADAAAAREALHANPGHTGAQELLAAAEARELDALRRLYLERAP